MTGARERWRDRERERGKKRKHIIDRKLERYIGRNILIIASQVMIWVEISVKIVTILFGVFMTSKSILLRYAICTYNLPFIWVCRFNWLAVLYSGQFLLQQAKVQSLSLFFWQNDECFLFENKANWNTDIIHDTLYYYLHCIFFIFPFSLQLIINFIDIYVLFFPPDGRVHPVRRAHDSGRNRLWHHGLFLQIREPGDLRRR